MSKNLFCKKSTLRNESDVEQFFILPLLKELGFTEDYIETKKTIRETPIGKGKKKKNYKPDYICYADKKHLKPVLVIDAKSPSEGAEDGINDSQLYTSIIRRKLREPKPVQYCVGSNGILTIIQHFEMDTPELELDFNDFQDSNEKFVLLKKRISRESLAKSIKSASAPFRLRKAEITEITGVFEVCHNTIRRKDGMGPEPAFYEFSKIMFVKLKKDKELHNDPEFKELIENGLPLPSEKVIFSSNWVEINEITEPNPINSILFRQLRDDLEYEVINKKKKRIFEKDEQIDLKPETIKEIVRLLEHLDLYGIDEDLNGRLFETF